MRYFAFADAIDVVVDEEYPWIDGLLPDGLAAIREQAGRSHARAVEVRYRHEIVSTGFRHLCPGVMIGQNGIIDLEYRAKIESTDDGNMVITSNQQCNEWFYVCLQLQLLGCGLSFVHGAGVAKDGAAVLLPSWGGVGKTAATVQLARRGWKVLGDDLVIVAADGRVIGFPKEMVIYPYHREILPELFQEKAGPIAPVWANAWLTRCGTVVKPVLRRMPGALAFARRHNPQSRKVRPQVVFGSDAIVSESRLSRVMWIDRTIEPLGTPSAEKIVSRVIGSTLSELSYHCSRLLWVLMASCECRLDERLGSWRRLLTEAFASVQCSSIGLPPTLGARDAAMAISRAIG